MQNLLKAMTHSTSTDLQRTVHLRDQQAMFHPFKECHRENDIVLKAKE